jgi:hypothetical protein
VSACVPHHFDFFLGAICNFDVSHDVAIPQRSQFSDSLRAISLDERCARFYEDSPVSWHTHNHRFNVRHSNVEGYLQIAYFLLEHRQSSKDFFM